MMANHSQQSQPQHLQQLPYPALYLYPLNDSFVPKHISLANGVRVKIGRQTNAKTSPAERNGYFDSKVLSRQHAEVWEEGGKILIKDVKSSNGTFINGERLSPEGVESEPFEMKSDDIVEFGIDIVGEDNKTIVHHKVAARVVCVFTEQDVQVAARAEAHQQQQQQQQQQQPSSSIMMPQPGPSQGNAFNFQNQQRRPPIQAASALGGMGGSLRQPGKSGLNFDHILSRLQGELQKSRETGAELRSLSGAMNEIHDTLGGSLPQNIPSYPAALPPVRPPQMAGQPAANGSASVNGIPPVDLSEIQNQLQQTQSSLAAHVDKVRALENAMAEQDALKREVGELREIVEVRRREELERANREMEIDHRNRDDDDAASVHTVVPHELERVEEEDEHQLALAASEGDAEGSGDEGEEEEREEQRRRRGEAGVRPRTPEPSSLGMREDDDERRGEAARRSSVVDDEQKMRVDELLQRLNALTTQVETALELSQTYRAQHTAAQETIVALQAKVTTLEGLVQSTQARVEEQAKAEEARAAKQAEVEAAIAASVASQEKEKDALSVTTILMEWKKSVEGQWSTVQEEWAAERERLAKARQEWEDRNKQADIKLVEVTSRIGVLEEKARSSYTPYTNGHSIKHEEQDTSFKTKIESGLATPPSPRSLSVESRGGRKKRRSSSHRGRSRSTSPIGTDTTAVEEPESTEVSGSISSGKKRLDASPKRADTNSTAGSEGDESFACDRSHTDAGDAYATPESSSYLTSPSAAPVIHDKSHAVSKPASREPHAQVMTAVGVLALSVAVASVLWHVKPE